MEQKKKTYSSGGIHDQCLWDAIEIFSGRGWQRQENWWTSAATGSSIYIQPVSTGLQGLIETFWLFVFNVTSTRKPETAKNEENRKVRWQRSVTVRQKSCYIQCHWYHHRSFNSSIDLFIDLIELCCKLFFFN